MTAVSINIILFWLALAALFYTYIGYGLLLLIRVKLSPKKKHILSSTEVPAVTLIVAAYNEADCILEKISNSLQLDYPSEKLNLLFVTDGSTDGTDLLVKKFHGIQLLHQPERQGKAAAINRAMKEVKTELVVFTDANSLLNPESLKRLVRHYDDPAIGGVAGEKKIKHDGSSTAVESGEGIYWMYESFLKNLDARFYSVIGAAGELYSIRTALFQPLEENTITDDFMISLQVCRQGYRMEYEPGAWAEESGSVSIKEEAKRKIRISAGSFQAMSRLGNLLNPFSHPRLFFQYLSRRVFRWMICPLALVICLVCNSWLFFNTDLLLYEVLFYAQCFFYALAAAGALLIKKEVKLGVLSIPYYFLFMNVCVVLGFFRFISGGQPVSWERAKRR
jgi:biofilm PGA synthesis N-glycosyltransferase PgaC